jgi:hypothetical protein
MGQRREGWRALGTGSLCSCEDWEGREGRGGAKVGLNQRRHVAAWEERQSNENDENLVTPGAERGVFNGNHHFAQIRVSQTFTKIN